jgi:hypothetical protein
MAVVAGVFLVLHGLVHVAVWLAPPNPDAPFDPRRTWALREGWPLIRTLAVAATSILVIAGALVLADASAAPATAIAGAVLSLILVVLTFNRWLLGAVAIDVAIVWIALSNA